MGFSKKHPLEHGWTLWFDNPSGKQNHTTWGQTLRSVHTFNSVEDFWCLYNNIVPPSRLVHGADLHLFKEGVEPKWEEICGAVVNVRQRGDRVALWTKTASNEAT